MVRKLSNRICEICKKEYTTISSNQRFCGSLKNKVGCSWLRYSDKVHISNRKRESYTQEKGKEYFAEKRRYRYFKWKYNLSKEEYDKKLEEQGGVCAICKCAEVFLNKILAIDHNHTTGEVRGLLCNKCNLGLGNFKDNASLLRGAIKYLNKYEI